MSTATVETAATTATNRSSSTNQSSSPNSYSTPITSSRRERLPTRSAPARRTREATAHSRYESTPLSSRPSGRSSARRTAMRSLRELAALAAPAAGAPGGGPPGPGGGEGGPPRRAGGPVRRREGRRDRRPAGGPPGAGGAPGGGPGDGGGHPPGGPGGAAADGGGPGAPAFALTPGTLDLDVLDYASKAGRKTFAEATQPLKDEFNGDSAKISVLQEQLNGKATDFGWNNEDTSDIINIPINIGAPNDTRNLIHEYSQLSTTAITEWARAVIVHRNTRRAQNNYNMYRCIFLTLDASTQAVMALERAQYEIDGVQVAALFYKVLISKAEVDTQATIALTRTALTKLDQKMLELESDVPAFNKYVKECKKKLNNRRAHSDDLLINLFTGYKAAQDSDFVSTITDIEKDYLHGKTPNLTDDSLMSQALLAYQVRADYGKWGALSAEQELIVALQAQVESIKDPRLKLEVKGKKKQSKKIKRNATTTTESEESSTRGRSGRRDRWQDKNPRRLETMEKNGTTYRWCKYHNQEKGMWVTHRLEDCCNRPQDQAATEDNAAHIANAAIIEINDDASSSSDEE